MKRIIELKNFNLLYFLAFIFLFDLMLLPMFHPFGIPFKPSHIIIILIPIYIKITRKRIWLYPRMFKRFWNMNSPIVYIAIIGIMGQMVLSVYANVNHYEAMKQTYFYLLMLLAFYFGQHLFHFPLKTIVWIFYGAVLTIILLSFMGDKVPWLANLWWKSAEVIEKKITQSNVRSTPFGDGSIVGSVTLFLCIVLSTRAGYLKISKIHMFFMLFILIATCFAISSRNQLVATAILGVTFAFEPKSSFTNKAVLLIVFFGLLLVFFVAFENILKTNFSFMNYAYNRFANLNLFDIETVDKTDNILRPLFSWDRFWNRFIVSPLIGSGYSTADSFPFQLLHYHNDWLYVFSTSGILGGFCFFVWMIKISRYVSIIALLPLFLPGLTNSFLCHMTAIIFYSFMLGLFIEKKFYFKGYKPPTADKRLVRAL